MNRSVLAMAVIVMFLAPSQTFAFSPANAVISPRTGVSSPGNLSGSGSSGITCYSNCTFVVDDFDSLVQVLGPTGALETMVALPSGACAYGVTQVGGNVFVDDLCNNQLDVIKSKTLTYVKSFSLTGGAYFSAYVPTVKMLYVAQFLTGKVVPFDPSTGLFGAPIAVCGVFESGISFNGGPNGDGLVYVPAVNGCYSTIDPSTGAVANYTLGRGPGGVACDSANGNCYISDLSANLVYEVKGGATIATINASGLAGPNGLAYNPVSQSVYVTNTGINDVVVIKGSSVVATITIKFTSGADCYKNGAIVVPLPQFQGKPSYAVGIGPANKVVWATNLGTTASGAIGCG